MPATVSFQVSSCTEDDDNPGQYTVGVTWFTSDSPDGRLVLYPVSAPSQNAAVTIIGKQCLETQEKENEAIEDEEDDDQRDEERDSDTDDDEDEDDEGEDDDEDGS